MADLHFIDETQVMLGELHESMAKTKFPPTLGDIARATTHPTVVLLFQPE